MDYSRNNPQGSWRHGISRLIEEIACGNSWGQLKKNWNDQVVMNEMGEGCVCVWGGGGGGGGVGGGGGGGGVVVMKKKAYEISRGLGFWPWTVGISKVCYIILWNWRGWSFILCGISKSKVTIYNMKIAGFSKNVLL